MDRNGVKVVEGWPGNSPDLNPIENVWGLMKRHISKRRISTMDELNRAIDAAWDSVPDEQLMMSMPGRLQKVVDLAGKHIGT